MNPLKLAGLLFFISSMIVILVFVVAEAVYPNFSLSNNKLSDLGAIAPVSILPVPASDVTVHQPSSSIFNSAVFLAGVFIATASLLIRKSLGNKILTTLNFLAGIGAIIAGLLTEQMGMIH